MKKTIMLLAAIMFCFTMATAQETAVDNSTVAMTSEEIDLFQSVIDASFANENANVFFTMTDEERNEMIDQFLVKNKKFFNKKDMGRIRDMLMGLDDSKLKNAVMYSEDDFKDPQLILAVSIVVPILTGNLLSGVDRILIGQVGLGILKTITWGGLGIWTLVDWFIISGKTRDYNMEMLKEACGIYY